MFETIQSTLSSHPPILNSVYMFATLMDQRCVCVSSIVRRTTVLLRKTLVPMVVLQGQSLKHAVSAVISTVAWTAKHLAMAVYKNNTRTM
jgi:hypothetical protein